MLPAKPSDRKSLLAAGIPLGQRRSPRDRGDPKFIIKDLGLGRGSLDYAKNREKALAHKASPHGRAVANRASKRWRATDNGKKVTAAVGKRYRASDHGHWFQCAGTTMGTTTPRIGYTEGWMRGVLERPSPETLGGWQTFLETA